ncbi:MAG: transposase [Myxococcales bacterium]|nr:transposase [Myxococcales bacterium]
MAACRRGVRSRGSLRLPAHLAAAGRCRGGRHHQGHGAGSRPAAHACPHPEPLAQRIGRVFVSATTWARLVRERGWRRPRNRVHPEKPTIGVRATRPNEFWHIDVTILKLLDGSKAYIHAVIDNYSRKILAWTVADRLDPATTCQVLAAAGRHVQRRGTEPGAAVHDTARPTLVADSGVENVKVSSTPPWCTNVCSGSWRWSR